MPKNAEVKEEDISSNEVIREEKKEVEAAQIRIEVDREEEQAVKEEAKKEEEVVEQEEQTDSKLKKYLLKMKKGNNLRK